MKGEKEMGKIGKKEERKDKYHGVYFLIFVVCLYIVLAFIEPDNVIKSLKSSETLLIEIVPVILLVIFFMGIMNYIVNPKTIRKYVGEGSGIKGWLLSISAGILSHGPVYVWYPLLKDLRNHGMRIGLIAAFIYSRAIKIPLLPLMIYYFGFMFVVLLTIYMIIAAVIQGKIIEIVIE
ncbi:MAG: membrane protein containing DUF318, transmembrane [Candidatus Syntrophoarchaeum caldarius]|uniref:Membrane protein containing DUF318, transmembrane n=1 Tax=Candidatus Syntropharchaeum caldarium TaxID=1838285 RepID=A0A1F2PAY4_9EURY|nr:MAG: membrane protein containing DUF318, transmembrane [Candidatus Syntrophoarchaeum caldarius]